MSKANARNKNAAFNLDYLQVLHNLLSCNMSKLVNSRKPFITPQIFRFVATWRCNCNCLMCGISQLNESQKEIPFRELELMVIRDTEVFQNIRKIAVTGGEPFLRKDLFKVILFLQSRCTKVREIGFSTNGSLTNKIIEDIKNILGEARDIKIVVTLSIDGIGELHNQIRGVENLFNDVLLTMEKLKQFEECYPNFEVHAQVTYNRSNLDKKLEIEKMLTQMRIPFSYDFIRLDGALYSNNEQGRRSLQTKALDRIFTKKNFVDYFICKQQKDRKRYLPCPAPYSLFSLKPDGTIMNCIRWGPMGNLYSDSLLDVFNVVKVKHVEAEIIRRGLCSTCYFRCGLAWRLYSDLPAFFKMALVQCFLSARSKLSFPHSNVQS